MRYKSKKGKHWYSPIWKRIINYLPSAEEQFFYELSLDNSCWYDEDEFGLIHTNKICGIQLGREKHNNTVRIGWRPTTRKGQKMFALCLYYYERGKRNWVDLVKLYPNQKAEIIMWLDDAPIVDALMDKDYSFCVNVKAKVGNYEAERTVLFRDEKPNWIWHHNPYFGGLTPALNEHIIELKSI